MKKIYKDRNFIFIISGKLVSLLGNAVYEIALIWYFLSEYGEDSGKILSLVMILGVLPSVIFGSFIGSLVDRYNKKIIMVVSDLVSGFSVLSVTALMHFDFMHSIYLLIITGILSLGASFVSISVNSIIPELFDSESLYAANSVNQFVERGTLLLGFSFGGVLVGIFGVEKVFLFNALSFIISAISEMFIVYSNKPHITVRKNSSFISDFREAAAFMRENRNLFRMTLIFAAVNLLWDPLISIVIPYILKNSFRTTSIQFGFIEAALPAGFCAGAIYFSKRGEFLKSKYILFYSIFAVNILLTLFSIPVVFLNAFYGGKHIIFFFFCVLAAAGVFSAALNISTSVSIQEFVPDSMLGKYWGFSRSLSAGLIPLGAMITGLLVGKVPSASFFIFSVSAVYLTVILIPRDSYTVYKLNSEGEVSN